MIDSVTVNFIAVMIRSVVVHKWMTIFIIFFFYATDPTLSSVSVSGGRNTGLWLLSISRDLFTNIFFREPIAISANDHRLLNGLERCRVFVTGSFGGIGKELTVILSSLGCDVMLHTSTSRTLLSDHSNASNKNLRPMFVLDFKNMTNLLRAKELAFSGPTDMVIHNAGLMSQWASPYNIHCVNCIAPMIITLHMLPSLFHAPHPRIVFVGSSSHLRSKPYRSGDIKRVLDDRKQSTIKVKSCLDAYATSKYNLMLLSTALQTRLQGCDVSIHTIHPGIVDTPMLQGFFGGLVFPGRHRLLLSPRESAWNVLLGALRAPVITDDGHCKPSYVINRKPNVFFTARSLTTARRKEQLEGTSELCFKELLQELPIEMRCDVVQSLKSFRRLHSSSMKAAASEIDSRVMLKRIACIDGIIREVESIR